MNGTGKDDDISAETVPLWTYFLLGKGEIKIGRSVQPRARQRLPRPPAAIKAAPPTQSEILIAKLKAARPGKPAHKRNHISNLIKQLRNHAKTRDPNVRLFLERAMARSMAHIEAA